jgi:hypothetical protein
MGGQVAWSGFGGAGFFFALNVGEPLGVGHGGSRAKHANPCAMSGFGEEDGDAELAGEHGQTSNVVEVFVGDKDGVEVGGIFANLGHSAQQFAAGKAGVNEDGGSGGRNDRGVTP